MSIATAAQTATEHVRHTFACDVHLMFEARGWIADCTGENTVFWQPRRVVNFIVNNYDGGLFAFQLHSN